MDSIHLASIPIRLLGSDCFWLRHWIPLLFFNDVFSLRRHRNCARALLFLDPFDDFPRNLKVVVLSSMLLVGTLYSNQPRPLKLPWWCLELKPSLISQNSSCEKIYSYSVKGACSCVVPLNNNLNLELWIAAFISEKNSVAFVKVNNQYNVVSKLLFTSLLTRYLMQ